MEGSRLGNDLLLRVVRGEAVERPPVWVMRQAGRYLKEYMAVRAQAGSFRKMIAHPEYAAEVTIQPIDLIGVDAAIIFSDILVIPEALGLPYEIVSKVGPVFEKTVRSERDFRALHETDENGNLRDTYEAIGMVKKALAGRVPLIGFAGAPWTIFCYMVEGGGSKTFSQARRMIYQHPTLAHALLQMITDATIIYLKGQIAAGADIVQVFDSWAGILNRETYLTFGLPYVKQICDAVKEAPKIVFAKDAYFAMEEVSELDCDVIGLDWHVSPSYALARVGDKAVQGNLDPCLIYAEPEVLEAKTIEMLKAFPKGKHIANLGHGIYPDMPPAHVKLFVDTVKGFRYE